MNGFHRRTELKKSMILDAAQKKLMDQSYKSAPIKQLANDANVSQVTIYNYFGSKDELLFAVLKRMMDQKLEEYVAFIASEAYYPKVIVGVMLEEMKFVKQLTNCICQASDHEIIKSKLNEYQNEKLVPFFLKIIDRGMDDGFISHDLNKKDLLFYFNMYQRELSRLYEGEEDVIAEETLIQFFFKGLVGDENVTSI